MIRAEETADEDGIRAVHLDSFPGPDEARLVDALRASGHLTVSLVAEVEATIVGHLAFSPVSTTGGSVGLGLGPVAVLPHYRLRGIAERLIRAGLEICPERGFGWVVVLGDPDYYRRFGFLPADSFGLSDDYGGGPAFQALEVREGALPVGAGRVKYGAEFEALS